MKSEKPEQLTLDFTTSRDDTSSDAVSKNRCSCSKVDYTFVEKLAEKEQENDAKLYKEIIFLAQHIS